MCSKTTTATTTTTTATATTSWLMNFNAGEMIMPPQDHREEPKKRIINKHYIYHFVLSLSPSLPLSLF